MEFEKKDRHPDWLWTAGLISVLAAVLCFFYGNIFFGIFLIIAGAVVILYALKHPKELEVTIDDSGVKVNEMMIPYKSITSFWLDENGKEDKLLLLVKGSVVPQMSLPLAGVTAEAVRTELLKHAPEVLMRESTSIKIAERLGF